MVENDLFEFSSLEQLEGLESMFGFQFENLVLNNLKTLFPILSSIGNMIVDCDDYSQTEIGVRPVISLKPGTMYTLGDGSRDNPYIVDTN